MKNQNALKIFNMLASILEARRQWSNFFKKKQKKKKKKEKFQEFSNQTVIK